MKFKILFLAIVTNLLFSTNIQANDINSSWNSAYLFHYAQGEKYNNLQTKLDNFIKINSKESYQPAADKKNKKSSRCLNFLKNMFRR